MLAAVHEQLDSLCRVERRALRVNLCAKAVMATAALAVVVAVVGLFLTSPVVPVVAVALLLVGFVVGGLFAIRVRKDWVGAAKAVDRHFDLSDRALTALACAAKVPTRPMDEIQVRDAVRRLSDVSVRDAARVSFRWRRVACAASFVALALAILAADRWGPADAPRGTETVRPEFLRGVVMPAEIDPSITNQGLGGVPSGPKYVDEATDTAASLGSRAHIESYFEGLSKPPR